jgi:cell division topological specificity factor
MISTLLDHLFQRSNVPSGAQVKQRLKFILAHDRAAIEPQVFENMRNEIMRVVSRYVELDEDSLDIRLESDKRMTALIANLPIKMVREELPDLIAIFDESVVAVDESSQIDFLTLEMDRFADEALDAIASSEIAKSASESSTLENTIEVAERTIEVTSKLRTAANKSQEPLPNEVTQTVTEAVTEKSDSDNSVESANEHHETEEVQEPEGDQLELSLGLSESLQSQNVVTNESSD